MKWYIQEFRSVPVSPRLWNLKHENYSCNELNPFSWAVLCVFVHRFKIWIILILVLLHFREIQLSLLLLHPHVFWWPVLRLFYGALFEPTQYSIVSIWLANCFFGSVKMYFVCYFLFVLVSIRRKQYFSILIRLLVIRSS